MFPAGLKRSRLTVYLPYPVALTRVLVVLATFICCNRDKCGRYDDLKSNEGRGADIFHVTSKTICFQRCESRRDDRAGHSLVPLKACVINIQPLAAWFLQVPSGLSCVAG